MNVFDRLMNKDQAALSEASREEALQGCSAPLTIMRVGKMLDSPGGTSEIQISKVSKPCKASASAVAGTKGNNRPTSLQC